MKSVYIYKMALRNISRNKRRTVLSITAIATAVLIVCFMHSYTTGIWINVKDNIFSFKTGHIKILNKHYLKEKKLMPLDLGIYGYKEIIKLIKPIKEIEYIFPRTKFGAILNVNGKMKSLIGFALDPQQESPVNPLKDKIVKGRMFKEFAPGQYEIMLGQSLAKELDVTVEDKITMMTKTAEEGLGHMTFKVAGIVSYGVAEFDKMFFYIPLSTAAKFLKMENEVIELAIYLKDAKKSIPVAKKIDKLLEQQPDNPYKAYPWECQNDGQYYKMFTMTNQIYTVVYVIFLILASLVIINTTMMVIYERMQEIGTISALGMRGSSIVQLFFYEAVIISIIGSFIGTVIGGLVSWIVSQYGINIAKLAGGGISMEFSEIIYPYFGADLLLFSFVLGIFVAAVCAFLPATRAARIEPVEAMRKVF